MTGEVRNSGRMVRKREREKKGEKGRERQNNTQRERQRQKGRVMERERENRLGHEEKVLIRIPKVKL